MHPPDQDIRHRLLLARLPAMPEVLVKLVEHLQAGDLSVEALAALIAHDPAMSARLLAVAHSAAYPRQEGILGLQQALALLGPDMIKILVMRESVRQTFDVSIQANGAGLRAFWKRSLTAAVIARALAQRLDYPQHDEAYLGGLLHDIGRLALLAAAPREYAFNFGALDAEALCAVEQRTLQITHAEAGAWLVERWQRDSFLADAILYHHEPSAHLEDAHPLIRIVHLAHLLASHPEDRAALRDGAALCGLDAATLDAVRAACVREVDAAAARFGINADDADGPPASHTFAAPMLDPVQQRLSEEVRTRVLVAEAGQAFARQRGETELLDAILRAARILFDVEHAAILLEDPSGQKLVGMPSVATPRLAEWALSLGRGGALAIVARERRIVYVQRADAPLALAEEQLLRLLGGDSLACVPLLAGARCLGVLVVAVAAWQLPACRQEERFLQAFGAQAAGALDAAFLEQGATRRALASMAEDYREASRRLLHEVNNPLAIIKNYLSVLDSKLERQEPVAGELSVLNEEIDRVGQLIGSLGEPTPQPAGARALDVVKVVDEVVRLFRAGQFVPTNVEIAAVADSDARLAEGNPDVLKQILVNLVKNAVEALRAGGGRIALVNRGHVQRERKLYLELAVTDDGPGLAPEVMANLFAPVQSTKGGSHRGLGLAIVHGLVQQLNGHIACRSGRRGTAFDILLPVPSGGGTAPLLAHVPGSV